MSRRGEGVDLSELTDGLRRGRFRGKMWFDLGEKEFTDEQRAEMMAALAKEFEITDEQCVRMVGGEAHPKGRSFDESLKALHGQHVRDWPFYRSEKEALLRKYGYGSHQS